MDKKKILQHYDYVNALASAKCSTRQDAEDLAAETMLAAFAFLHNGGIITHPKTWLASTLIHKYNSILRKKYRQPQTVNIDTVVKIQDQAGVEAEYLKTEEAAAVRRQLIYLADRTREILVRYYFSGNSIETIAASMNIPQGTVKSRLAAGREQMKKGLEQMDKNQLHLPGHLDISWSGTSGPNLEPASLVENDLIAQNILILAYEKPILLTELAKAMGIPTVYLEPIMHKLINGELMAKSGNKYYSDFIIYKPEDSLNTFDIQLNFVQKHFDTVWSVMDKLIRKIDALPYSKTLNIRQLTKLERYAVLLALQNFQMYGCDALTETPVFPNRKDGGHWLAFGSAFPAGYDMQKFIEANAYVVQGGHRTNGGTTDYLGAKFLQLCEFDTTLWDNPGRYRVCGINQYFDGITDFLWCIYKGFSPEEGNINTSIIESIDQFIDSTGFLVRENGKLSVDIPVISQADYKNITDIVKDGYEELKKELGSAYENYLDNNMLPIPPHLKNIWTGHRYTPITSYIVMGIVREAYKRGLHLKDVDYFCPPSVLVYG